MKREPSPAGRRRLLQGALAAACAPGLVGPSSDATAADQRGTAKPGAPDAAARKVLRVVFRSAETSFDPARITDLYSRCVTAHIFEALYCYDHLAPDGQVRPLTADGMPQVSADYREHTIKVRRGIHFADDPVFAKLPGGKRELTARDYVYAMQRVVDPANISSLESQLLELGILGLKEARDAAVANKGRFDYERPIEGLTLLDSHTLRIRVAEPRPRLVLFFADSSLMGGQAREVVEAYGDRIGEHPVGTGPFRLKSWRRTSRIVLERNPGYREVFYTGMPAADDAEGQALLQRFKGRRLPMVDEVEVTVIDEDQPRWLSFLNAEVDALASMAGPLPQAYTPMAAPGGQLAPNLAKRGVQMHRHVASDCSLTYFNMKDPVVGGMSPAQVALRRAIGLAYDTSEEIRLIRRGQASIAQSVLMPHLSGYDPSFKSEMGDFDPVRANALLDLFGFADRNGDGWRERPDGSPLLLEMASEPDQINRQFNELWQKSLKRVNIRVAFKTQQWAENLKAATAGKLMMWTLGLSADSPDGASSLAKVYGPQAGQENYARFQLDEMDKLVERVQLLPDGPERNRLFRQASRLAVAYMPYKMHVHRLHTDLLHPWVSGYRRPLFANEWWHTVDVDTQMRQQSRQP